MDFKIFYQKSVLARILAITLLIFPCLTAAAMSKSPLLLGVTTDDTGILSNLLNCYGMRENND